MQTEILTRLGRIRGLQSGDVISFLGVRYAEPPRRFQPPTQSGAWKQVYDATNWGPQPIQRPPSGAAALAAPLPNLGGYSEDCLRLNIHVPARASRAPRPVFVWIYGGAFIEGSANQYDGSWLAEAADAVVVAINYRLGIFGCMDLRPLGSGFGKSVNVWLQDQITALEWLRDNIADFGGDPTCVTIMGQSAGGTSVTALCASADARGLFHRAVANSPAFMVADATNNLLGVAKMMKLSPDEAHRRLASASTDELLKLSGKVFFYPYIDGDVVREKPETALLAQASVPLIAGFAPEDGKFLEYIYRARGMSLISWRLGITAKFVAPLVAGSADQAKLYLKRLKNARRPSNGAQLSELVWTDMHRRSSLIHCEATTRAGGNAWHYLFDVPCLLGSRAHPPTTATMTPLTEVPATHCVDIPFTLGWLLDSRRSHWVPRNERTLALAGAWIDALSRFARTGNPEGGSLGEWPAYGSSRNSRIVSTGRVHIAKDLDAQYRTSIWTSTL